MSVQLYPMGDNPPYAIDTGFSIAAPARNAKILLSYNSCKVKDNMVTDFSVSTMVITDEDMVTPIGFDGNSLFLGEIETNRVVTLEFIDGSLKSIESGLESK